MPTDWEAKLRWITPRLTRLMTFCQISWMSWWLDIKGYTENKQNERRDLCLWCFTRFSSQHVGHMLYRLVVVDALWPAFSTLSVLTWLLNGKNLYMYIYLIYFLKDGLLCYFTAQIKFWIFNFAFLLFSSLMVRDRNNDWLTWRHLKAIFKGFLWHFIVFNWLIGNIIS